MKYYPFKSCGSSILYVEKNQTKTYIKQKKGKRKTPNNHFGWYTPKKIIPVIQMDTLVELLKIPKKTFSSIPSGTGWFPKNP